MPTTEQLKAMAEHAQYEVNEFRKAIRDLPSLRERDPDWNRALESALLHFRILRGFFFCEGRHNDDVFARHYADGWQPTRDDVFDETKDAIDKRLAHLTLERLTRKNWLELDRMNAAIESLVSEFKKSLSTSQASWFLRLEKPTVQVIFGAASNSTQSGPR